MSVTLWPGRAFAQTRESPSAVTFQAGDVLAEARERELRLRRGVVVTYDRYRIESEDLRLQQTNAGVVMEGEARVAFCPCAESPVALVFDRGRMAPPGDLMLTTPRLEVGSVPVFALPWIWLRTPDHIGLLPPLAAWRGDDGLLLGGGVHLPWRSRSGAGSSPDGTEGRSALDLTAGGYVIGGIDVAANLQTPTTTTRFEWDHVRGDRVVARLHGSRVGPNRGDVVLAWDVDASRGNRARSGTIDLRTASLPHDTLEAEAIVHRDTRGLSLWMATGASARGPRGEGTVAAGPSTALAIGSMLGSVGAWDATLSASVFSPLGAQDLLPASNATSAASAIPVALTMGSMDLHTNLDPIAVRFAIADRFAVADEGPAFEPSKRAAAAAGLELSLPLVRTLGEPQVRDPSSGAAPLVHWIAPMVEVQARATAGEGTFFEPFEGQRPLSPVVWLAGGGVSTSIGRYTGGAVRMDLRTAALGYGAHAPLAVAHARLGAATVPFALGIEQAAASSALTSADPFDAEESGYATIAHARLGPETSAHIGVNVAGTHGIASREARAVADGSAVGLVNHAMAYLTERGWTGGTEVAVPWIPSIRTTARADADLTAGELLGVGTSTSYRHPCGCFAALGAVSHRLGRGGTDVMLTVDLAPQ